MLLVVAAVLAILPAGRSAAAITTPFTARFEVNANGAVLLRGNANMTCPAQSSGCVSARNGVGSTAGEALNDNGHLMAYTNADGDPATFNDSRATITMPPGSTVLFAGLYWGADPSLGVGGLPAPNAADKDQVLFRTPAAATWQPIIASSLYPISPSGAYQGFADVTALVAGAGNGVYSVANIQAGTGADRYAGWSLAIAYRNAAEDMRSLRIYDGFGSIVSGSVNIPVAGFETPHTGAVHARVGAVAYEGDLGKTGDGLRLNGQSLSDAANPANNIFNSTASDGGAILGGRDPAHRNLFGVDIDQFDAGGILANGATSATLTMSTAGETYYPGVITFTIDLYAPKITTTVTGTDVDGGDLLPGDVLEYRIAVRNDGSDTADDVVLSNAFPVHTTYVPGTLTVQGVPVTDATDDDRGQVSSGAAGFTLGSIPYLGTTYVTFRVQVSPATPPGYAITNLVNVAYTGRTTSVDVAGVGGSVATPVQQPHVDLAAGLAVVPAFVQRGAAPNAVAYTATVTNNGADLEPAARAELTLPAGISPGQLPSGCSVTGPVVTCTLGPLVAGSRATVTVPADADAGVSTGAVAGLRVSGAGQDAAGGNDTASATLWVNSPPTAVADTATTTHGAAVVVPVRANDSDPDDPATVLTVSVVTPPVRGTAVVLADHTVRYTPAPGWTGADSFTYQIDDGTGGTATAVATVTTANALPTANDDLIGTKPNTAVMIKVLANDTDPNDSDPLHLAGVDPVTAAEGTVSQIGDEIRFEPEPAFLGRVTIGYTVADSHGGQDTGQAVVDVANAAPTAADDAKSTPYRTAVWIDVLDNDRDPDGDTLTISPVFAPAPAHGVAGLSAGGISYQPVDGFSGTDTFGYTISDGTTTSTATVTVTVGNADPSAPDRTIGTPYGTAVTIDVLTLATDPNGGTLLVGGTTNPADGTVTRNPDGSLTYTPDAGFSGTDFFDYTVHDGQGGADTARVTVTVLNGEPVARPDSVTAVAGLPLVIDVLANDDDDPNGDPLTITVVPAAGHGNAVVGPDRRITYTPTAGFLGSDTFGYRLDDGQGGISTATVTVTTVNTAPITRPDTAATDTDTPVTIDVLDNDEDPNSDALTLVGVTAAGHGTVVRNADDTLTYTPAGGFTGIDAFSYTVRDPQSLSVSEIVTITVRNAAPVAVDDVFLVQPGVAVPLSVLANDHDPNTGQALRVVSAGPAGRGTVGPVGATTVTYRADPGSTGLDTFGYVVTDSLGQTDSGLVTVTIDRPPEPVDDTASTASETPVDIVVLANDSDPDGSALTVVAVGAPSHGTAWVGPGWRVGYRPRAGFAGTDAFSYTVRDSVGHTAVAWITVQVANAAPVARPDRAAVTGGRSVTIDVLANDSDANDGQQLTIASVDTPRNGSAVAVGDRIRYTPATRWSGSDTFTYSVSDGAGGIAQAPVTVTADVPLTVPDRTAIAEPGRPVGITLPGTSTDGKRVTPRAVSKPAHGTAVLNADGTVTYVPDPGFAGVDTFTYEVVDAYGNVATATITVTVPGRPGPPTPSAPSPTLSTPAPGPATPGPATPGPPAPSPPRPSIPVSGPPSPGPPGAVPNAPPVARADRVTVVAGDTVVLRPLANDHDPDGDPIAVDKIEKPRHGTATAAPDGTIRYASSPDAEGSTDTFAYSVRDGRDAVGTATVTVRVVSADRLPLTGRNLVAVATGGGIIVATGSFLYWLSMRTGRPGAHRGGREPSG